ETIQSIGRRAPDSTMHNEHSDNHGNLLAINQIIEDDRSIVLQAILKDHHAGRLCSVILLWHIHRVLARGPRKYLAAVERAFNDFPFRHAFLWLGVRSDW